MFPLILKSQPPDCIQNSVNEWHFCKVISPSNLSKILLDKVNVVGDVPDASVSESSHEIFAVITPSTGSVSHVSPSFTFAGSKLYQSHV